MEHKEYFVNALKELKEKSDEIAGKWNGDESGILEDNAHTAIEISDKCDQIIELIIALK